MNTIDTAMPVGTIARCYPAAVDVFEQLDVDYACRGGRSLKEACDAAGVDAEMVAGAIASAAARPSTEPTIAELVHAILFEQHVHERNVMTQVGDLLRRDRGTAPEIARIRRIFTNLETLILQHMQREERDLFPSAEKLEKLVASGELPRGSSLASRLCIEYVEHDMIDATLHKLRELRLRAELNGAPRDLIQTLDGFERRVYRHMHVENNVLFPMALEMENRLREAVMV
jgi:regulator of cell morphogenesis and NO signaling